LIEKRRMWRGIRWLGLAAALALVGCGGGSDVVQDTDNSAEKFSGDKREAAQVVEDFSVAIAAGDWAKICELNLTVERVEVRGVPGLRCGCPRLLHRRRGQQPDLHDRR
jgi:hypothetical protein